MKKVLILVAGVVMLTGCGVSRNFDEDLSNNLFVETTTVDSEEVTCVIYSGPSRGGLDCDFG